MNTAKMQQDAALSQIHSASIMARISALTAQHNQALTQANITSRELEGARAARFALEQANDNTSFISERIVALASRLDNHLLVADNILQELVNLERNFQEQLEDDRDDIARFCP
jgi:hypothetical protein